MIIHSIRIAGYGPLRRFERIFDTDTNCLIGVNGVGKTTLLRVLSGLTGVDGSTALLAGHEVAFCELVVREGRMSWRFETEGQFDPDHIDAFKKLLPTRSSFPHNEWGIDLSHQCGNIATLREMFARYWEFQHRGEKKPCARYSPLNREVGFHFSDGEAKVFSLFFNDTPDGVPLFWEHLEHHLDIMIQEVMLDWLRRSNRQFFYTTHSPQMLTREGSAIEFGQETKIIIDNRLDALLART